MKFQTLHLKESKKLLYDRGYNKQCKDLQKIKQKTPLKTTALQTKKLRPHNATFINVVYYLS